MSYLSSAGASSIGAGRVMLWVHGIHFLLCFLTSASGQPVAEPGLAVGEKGPFVVKLRKQAVPVKRGQRVVAHKAAYFGNVSLGYPAQPFLMVFDTGSGHVLVPLEECTSIPCGNHTRYKRSKSLSAVDIDHDGTPIEDINGARDQATIAFGTGEVTGEFINEVVCVSQHDGSEEWVKGSKVGPGCVRLRVVTATQMTTEPFSSFKFDGVLGLGLQALALAPEFSFFKMMVAGNHLRDPYFSVYLAHGDNEESEIMFGGYNRSRLHEDLQWAVAEKPDTGYWQVKINRISIGDQHLDICDPGDCYGIVDTGTSLLAVPRSSVITLQKRLLRPAPNNRTDIDCRSEPGAPIKFHIDGGFTLSLENEDYARPAPFLAVADLTQRLGNNNSAVANSSSEMISYCRPSMMPIDMKPPMSVRTFIFGEPILRKYISVFDWVTPRIGFALAASKEQAIPTPAEEVTI